MFHPWSLYWIAVGISAFSIIGASAISKAISGWLEFKTSLIVGSVLLIAYCLGSAICWWKQKKSARYSFYVSAYAFFAALTLALAAVLPIFYLLPVWTIEGTVLLAVWVFTTAIQINMAKKYFDQQWLDRGEKIFQTACKNNFLDIDLLNKKFQAVPPNITDLKPEWAGVIFKLVLILSLVLGLNFRKIYPILSAFAWAIPSIIIAGIGLQVVLVAVLKGRKVAAFEASSGVFLIAKSKFER